MKKKTKKQKVIKKKHPAHNEQLVALRRIEGQIRGIQKMIQDKRYCVDILTQLSAAGSAVASVQNSILERHLDACFKTAFERGSALERKKKTAEVLKILKTFRKN